MKIDFIMFFTLIIIFFILLFLSGLEIDFSNFLMGKIFQNKTTHFIIIGVGIFIFGKKIIDYFDNNSLNN